MQIGWNGMFGDALAAKADGCDFLEVNIQQALRGDEEDDAWAAATPSVDSLALPVLAANCLLPASHKPIGPAVDWGLLKRYMRRVAQRAGRLGIRYLVFGSGGARMCPEGFDWAEAQEQLVAFCRMAGDACGEHGVTLAVEHLHRGETNTINTLPAMFELLDKVGHERVEALVDSYHFGLEEQRFEDLAALGGRVAHVHVAEPVGRVEPNAYANTDKKDQGFDFVGFFAALRLAGYDGGVTFEGKHSGPIAETRSAWVGYVREAWARAGDCLA